MVSQVWCQRFGEAFGYYLSWMVFNFSCRVRLVISRLVLIFSSPSGFSWSGWGG